MPRAISERIGFAGHQQSRLSIQWMCHASVGIAPICPICSSRRMQFEVPGTPLTNHSLIDLPRTVCSLVPSFALAVIHASTTTRIRNVPSLEMFETLLPRQFLCPYVRFLTFFVWVCSSSFENTIFGIDTFIRKRIKAHLQRSRFLATANALGVVFVDTSSGHGDSVSQLFDVREISSSRMGGKA